MVQATRVSSEDFALAVDNAGGDGVAAAMLGISPATVRRWKENIPGRKKELLILQKMARHLPGAPPPAVRDLSDDDLLEELAYRLRSGWGPDRPLAKSGQAGHESTTTRPASQPTDQTAVASRRRRPTVVSRRQSVDGDGKGNVRDQGIQEDG